MLFWPLGLGLLATFNSVRDVIEYARVSNRTLVFDCKGELKWGKRRIIKKFKRLQRTASLKNLTSS